MPSAPVKVIPSATDKVAYIVTDQVEKDIETVIGRIELANTDITSNYADWIKIGFAFANILGDGGRQYFHRVDRRALGRDCLHVVRVQCGMVLL